jgi:hypothetical protein
VSHQRGGARVGRPVPGHGRRPPASGQTAVRASRTQSTATSTASRPRRPATTTPNPLARLTAITGSRNAGTLPPEDYAAVMARLDGAAAATWNRHLSALTSFTAWAQRNEILTTNPDRRLERCKPACPGDRPIPRGRLEKLFTDDRHGLRERVLWRMLYETAARAEEILTSTSKTSIRSSGEPASLPKAVPSSTSTGPPAPPLSCPGCYSAAPPARCSSPTGAHPPPELQAKSRHQHLASLGRYVRLGEQTSARVTAEADPAARRRAR